MGDVIPMKSEVVALEVAEAEFARFVEAFDLNVDLDRMDAEDRRSFDAGKETWIRAMQQGRLVVDEHGQPVYTPVKGNDGSLTFHEPTGAALLDMDKAKKNADMHKTNLLLAAVTKQPIQRFARMAQRDLKVCQAIFCFLLGG